MRIVAVIRRELRLHDNPLFQDADAHAIIPLFVSDDAPSAGHNENLTSLFAFALAQLGQCIAALGGRLYSVREAQQEAFFSLARPDLVRFCDDVRPHVRERNAALVQLLDDRGIPHQTLRDHSLTPIPEQPFTTFARFYKHHFLPSLENEILSYPTPRRFVTPAIPVTEAALPIVVTPASKGWLRTEGEVLGMWAAFIEHHLADYSASADIPAAGATSRMSPYVGCGIISLRRMFRESRGASESFVRSLARHDYFAQLLAHFPGTPEHALDDSWWHFPWRHDSGAFARWQQGETGFPLVDAGMRQLRQEGWLDNRIRMVVASFLTRDLLVDWRWGEQYFARQLVDADLAQNVGNWQWVTGCGGPDSIHYFRVLNPLVQAQRFDPAGLYTRRYLPELRDVPAAALTRLVRLRQAAPGYPLPMVDLAAARRTFMEIARREVRRPRRRE
ncbi:MAG: cryptochrome/photolyase family protein [Chloroflexota bacterium]